MIASFFMTWRGFNLDWHLFILTYPSSFFWLILFVSLTGWAHLASLFLVLCGTLTLQLFFGLVSINNIVALDFLLFPLPSLHPTPFRRGGRYGAKSTSWCTLGLTLCYTCLRTHWLLRRVDPAMRVHVGNPHHRIMLVACLDDEFIPMSLWLDPCGPNTLLLSMGTASA